MYFFIVLLTSDVICIERKREPLILSPADKVRCDKIRAPVVECNHAQVFSSTLELKTCALQTWLTAESEQKFFERRTNENDGNEVG